MGGALKPRWQGSRRNWGRSDRRMRSATRGACQSHEESHCRKQKCSCKVSPNADTGEDSVRKLTIDFMSETKGFRGEVSTGHTTSVGMWLSSRIRCLQGILPPPRYRPTEGSGSSKEANPAVRLRSFGRASDPSYEDRMSLVARVRTLLLD